MSSNTYAINTTRGKEFEVEADLLALGLKPWTPRLLTSKTVKEKKVPIWYDAAYVPKLLFCVFPAVYWPDVVGIKHVIGKPAELSRRDIDGVPAHVKAFTDANGDRIEVKEVPGLHRFKEAVEAEYADKARLRANNEYQCAYTPGQAVELLQGAFADLPATFRDVVRHSHDEYTKLRVDVEMFGRKTTVEIDPISVRASSA